MTTVTTNMDGALNQPPARKCKRPAGPLTRRQCREAHVEKMARKRLLRSNPQTGFLPIQNRRINAAVDAAMAVIMLASAERVSKHGGNPISAFEAREQAVREIARKLPRPAMVFDWRKGAVSKNNNPEYRKSFVRQL
jgi:hypothetical protein